MQVENKDDLDEFDRVANKRTETKHNEDTEKGDLGVSSEPVEEELMRPIQIDNAFQSLADYVKDVEEGELTATGGEEVVEPISVLKRKHDKNPIVPKVIAIGSADQLQNLDSKVNSTDKDGFTPVINKKSLRLESKSAKSKF